MLPRLSPEAVPSFSEETRPPITRASSCTSLQSKNDLIDDESMEMPLWQDCTLADKLLQKPSFSCSLNPLVDSHGRARRRGTFKASSGSRSPGKNPGSKGGRAESRPGSRHA